MRFIANYVLNAQGFTSEAKDVILSVYKSMLPYMGNFYVRIGVRTGFPSGDA